MEASHLFYRWIQLSSDAALLRRVVLSKDLGPLWLLIKHVLLLLLSFSFQSGFLLLLSILLFCILLFDGLQLGKLLLLNSALTKLLKLGSLALISAWTGSWWSIARCCLLSRDHFFCSLSRSRYVTHSVARLRPLLLYFLTCMHWSWILIRLWRWLLLDWHGKACSWNWTHINLRFDFLLCTWTASHFYITLL